MSINDHRRPVPIRLVFEMSREEHPRLYDDLMRFAKGTKRINRLRTLAHDGLLMQYGPVVLREAATPESDRSPAGPISATESLTNQIFEVPIAE